MKLLYFTMQLNTQNFALTQVRENCPLSKIQQELWVKIDHGNIFIDPISAFLKQELQRRKK